MCNILRSVPVRYLEKKEVNKQTTHILNIKMDYSTLKNIQTPREFIASDGHIDLSVSYVNDDNNEKNEIINNSGSGRSDASVVDDEQCTVINNDKINFISKTKIKLNFSVDRILGNNNCDPIDDEGQNIRKTTINDSPNFGYSNNNNCTDCSTTSSSLTINQQPQQQQQSYSIFSVPFSMASMINKTLIRPMPVRYLTGSGTVPLHHATSSSSATAASLQSQHLKYHPHLNYAARHIITASSQAASSCNSLRTHQPFNSNKNHHTRPSITTVIADSSASNQCSNSLKRKRSWSRAVFSQLQRKGLEIQFQIQKYITKPDRRKLAARLGLTDAQVKVWFQNRRMKWRHTRESKINHEKLSANGCNGNEGVCKDKVEEQETSCSSNASSSDENEDDIDVEAE